MPASRLTVWFKEVRAPFLLLPTIFVPLGVAVAWVHGSFDLATAALTFAAAICMHASVNVLNDYFDFRSGLDLATTPTPFSGGSRVLPDRQLTPGSVLAAGIAFLGVGLAIGVYFLFTFAFSPVLLAIIAISSVAIVAYTSVLSRSGVGELVAGLNFGPLLILGTYFLQTGSLAVEPLILGTTLGIMVAGILYINEFPDTFADMEVGRRHLVVRWGKAKAAARFRALVLGAYVVLVAGVVTGYVFPVALISLLALPKAWAATSVLSREHDKVMELIPGMANMVMATIWTGLLLLAGYLIMGLLF